MARNRLPKIKAEITGAALKNPGRHRSRREPLPVGTVGAPYANMTEPQRDAWHEFVAIWPWLTAGDRPLLHLAAVLHAKAMANDLGLAGINTLQAILSKMGATPVDQTRIMQSEKLTEADEFFFT